MRTARIKGGGGDYYHCMSRVIERRFVLGEVERERFRGLLRACERFCGVRVLTYALLSNHFHILVEVPERGEPEDAELVRRVGALYGGARARDLEGRLEALRERGAEQEAGTLRARYLYRMGDVSEFMKTLKQRFTQSYNRSRQRRGTLWEERFKSVLVESGRALATMAAYIDLNAVRAGLVKDPAAYRYCGYGEAVAGSKRARAGLGAVLASVGQPSGWGAAQGRYREWLYVEGEGSPARAGFSPEQVRAVLASGGKLSAGQALRCRVRYFSDGVALGSQAFVESVFQAHRGYFGTRRQSGARPMRRLAFADLFTARDLRLAAVTPPG
jgi:putative transposase